MDANAGPDEIYRWLVAEWIANNGKLPTGFELDIVNPVWCYSYAFTPYLPSMIAGIFVKIAMVFTSNAQVLLFAARLISIISGMGTIYVKAGTEFADAKKRFLVRWTPTEINTSMYLLYMGELHNIQYVNRYRDNKDYMEIWTDWKGQEADENWIEPVKEGDDSGTS